MQVFRDCFILLGKDILPLNPAFVRRPDAFKDKIASQSLYKKKIWTFSASTIYSIKALEMNFFGMTLEIKGFKRKLDAVRDVLTYTGEVYGYPAS